jgi:dihydrofolate reductase
MIVRAVVAVDGAWGIGKDGKMPWHSKRDMRWFRLLTTSLDDQGRPSVVIMGRKTWDSLGRKALPDRYNIILTSYPKGQDDSVLVAPSMQDALRMAEHLSSSVFVIGGAQVYQEALRLDVVDEVIVTKMEGVHQCDTFFPGTYLEKNFVSSWSYYKKATEKMDSILIRAFKKETTNITLNSTISGIFQVL